MTEPKVVHEWEWKFAGSDLSQYQMKTQLGQTGEDDYPTYYMRIDEGGKGWGDWFDVGAGHSLALELARLAAEVEQEREIKAELQRLLKEGAARVQELEKYVEELKEEIREIVELEGLP
jgi:hypothetical protein